MIHHQIHYRHQNLSYSICKKQGGMHLASVDCSDSAVRSRHSTRDDHTDAEASHNQSRAQQTKNSEVKYSGLLTFPYCRNCTSGASQPLTQHKATPFASCHCGNCLHCSARHILFQLSPCITSSLSRLISSALSVNVAHCHWKCQLTQVSRSVCALFSATIGVALSKYSRCITLYTKHIRNQSGEDSLISTALSRPYLPTHLTRTPGRLQITANPILGLLSNPPAPKEPDFTVNVDYGKPPFTPMLGIFPLS